MWRKKRKTLLIAAAVLYVLFGVLAFFDIPGGHDEHHHTFSHNLTHIILGLVLLGGTLRTNARVRRILCFCFAAGYIVVGAAGATMAREATLVVLPGVIEFHAGDYGVHLATALLFLVLGFLRRSDKPTGTPPENGGWKEGVTSRPSAAGQDSAREGT